MLWGAVWIRRIPRPRSRSPFYNCFALKKHLTFRGPLAGQCYLGERSLALLGFKSTLPDPLALAPSSAS